MSPRPAAQPPRPWGGLAYPLILLALCGLLFFGLLGQRSLWETDEARYGEIAREMVQSGDWVTPRLNYVKYFEKPILTYCLVAGQEFKRHQPFWYYLPLLPAAFLPWVAFLPWAMRQTW
ncbi:MAG: hypothetical protein HY794_18285, partial [Desulfarculus sp.]|nr:hypothetical protein [Desulfarculus sp.]